MSGVPQVLLGVVGVAAAAYGVLLLLRQDAADLLDSLLWLAGGVVVHDAVVAPLTVLATLGPHHRSALTLRYLDGLPVREVAALFGRTEGATEVLLVRAKAAFRAAYPEEGS